VTLIEWGAGGFIAGAIAGSFIATLAVRWPSGKATNGRSECDTCTVQLRWFELVPLISFIILRGKCRRCGAKITREHFLIELICALIGALALIMVPGGEGVAGAYFGWLLVALAILDFRYFWLPDRLTFLLGATGFLTGALGLYPSLSDRMIGGAVGYTVLRLIAWGYYRLRGQRGMGAGDPKMLGAIGLWLGWQVLPFVLLGASVVGLALILVQFFRKPPVTAQTRLPLGGMMAVAAFPIWLFIR
jgi:leader peptidase (prepilin peptidase)/N-methyltransferase